MFNWEICRGVLGRTLPGETELNSLAVAPFPVFMGMVKWSNLAVMSHFERFVLYQIYLLSLEHESSFWHD